MFSYEFWKDAMGEEDRRRLEPELAGGRGVFAPLLQDGSSAVDHIADPEDIAAGIVQGVERYARGVGGTDAALYRGEYPASMPVVIGHEFSGEEEAVGKGVSNLQPGQRVTVDPNVVCHACEYCRWGREHLCEQVSSLDVHRDGTDAEYCVMPAGNVYPLPDGVSFETAAFCEPLACAVHGLDLAQVRLGDTVLILGADGMGNLIAQYTRDAGAGAGGQPHLAPYRAPGLSRGL